jgi:CopG family nickel-responsive transcriptional regulator
MQRITVTIDDDLLAGIDRLMATRGYASRSEALRDILRARLDREATASPASPCIATLSYVYDHETRALARRLIHAQHDRHDLAIASLHVHLDHDTCLEVAVLRGPTGEVTRPADMLTAQRGVRHAALHVVPVTVTEARHRHGAAATAHTHLTA